ncbi:MAG: hypothetical protein U0625_10025 [Phycisphaerales bacterium]
MERRPIPMLEDSSVVIDRAGRVFCMKLGDPRRGARAVRYEESHPHPIAEAGRLAKRSLDFRLPLLWEGDVPVFRTYADGREEEILRFEHRTFVVRFDKSRPNDTRRPVPGFPGEFIESGFSWGCTTIPLRGDWQTGWVRVDTPAGIAWLFHGPSMAGEIFAPGT